MRSFIEPAVMLAASGSISPVPHALAHTLATVALLGGMLWLAGLSTASATSTALADKAVPADVLDIYMGVVNMNRCCDCHAVECR